MAETKNEDLEDLPVEEIEEKALKPKSKATGKSGGKEPDEHKARRPKADKEASTDAEDARPRKKAKPNELKVPYPPSPEGVPDDLTDYPASFVRQQNLLLSGLFLFLMFYIGAVLFFALVGFWCVWSLSHWFPVKVVGIVFSGLFFLYLVKGFFKRHPIDKEMHIEITADEQPVLFAFIDQLCDELEAPHPNRVFVSADVNAAVMPRASLINLFVEPKKDLLIGLGLVNCMNLTEFKSVLAHEFGHFSQSATSSSYAYIASRIIGDLISGEDWFDRAVNWCKHQNNFLRVIGLSVGGVLWLGRTILWQVFKIITLQRMAVMRESEFHADLVAVKAGGSDAVALSLFRLKFGNLCLMQAVQDLAVARDHKLYSRDLFLHQDRAATVVRQKRKDPELGLPPAVDYPMAGKTIRLFDPADGDDTDDVPEMRRTHPPAHELEASAKETYIPAVADHRSPWILFTAPDDLRERMTYKFYRMIFKVPKNTELSSAVEVQRFIDNEHSETTYDPKYKGCYDDRPLKPGDPAELNGIIKSKPWTEERMEKVLEKLYDGCEENVETLNELHKELESLRNSATGRPSSKLKRQIESTEQKRDESWEWFKSFDRRVYILHVQMAAQAAPDLQDELVERYRFQLEVQRLYTEARYAYDEAERYLSVLAQLQQRYGDQVSGEFIGEVLRVLRASWKSLKNIIRDAKDLNLPAMKNFEEGKNLADFILEGKMVPEPPLSYAKGAWIAKLKQQLQSVRSKCFRLHFKSVGGILRMQEEIAAKWKAAREPIAAEEVPAEVVPAEILGEEVPAELVEAEVIEAEVLPAAPLSALATPPVIPTPEQKPEPAPAVVAFVAPPSPEPAPELPPPPPVAPGSIPEPKIETPAPVASAHLADTTTLAAVTAPAIFVPDPPASAPAQLADMSALAAVAAPAMTFAPDPPVGPAVPAEEVFALNSDPEPEGVPPVGATAPTTAASDDLFTLNANELHAKGTTPKPLESLSFPVEEEPIVTEVEVIAEVEVLENVVGVTNEAPAVTAPKPAEPALSGLTEVAKPRIAETPVVNLSLDGDDLGFPAPPAAPGFKPANGKRPAIRVTMVLPGERSPLAK